MLYYGTCLIYYAALCYAEVPWIEFREQGTDTEPRNVTICETTGDLLSSDGWPERDGGPEESSAVQVMLGLR